MFVYNVYHLIIKCTIVVILYVISMYYLTNSNNHEWYTTKGVITDSICKYIIINKHRPLIACKLNITYKYNDIQMESELFLNSNVAYYVDDTILINVNKINPILIKKAEIPDVIIGIVILLFDVLLCLLVF